MRKYLLTFLIFLTMLCDAQKENWTRLSFNPQLKIDTAFNNKWSYPWYVIKNDDGSFENTMSDSITTEDTAHQYFTAVCTNTHMGNHEINYCKAYLYNDDVELHFSGQPPGYNEEMVLVIRKNYFKGQYNFQSVAPQKGIKVNFQIISQKLVLTGKPAYDSIITGTVEIRFRERIENGKSATSKKAVHQPAVTYSKLYVLKGRFHTRLSDILEIE